MKRTIEKFPDFDSLKQAAVPDNASSVAHNAQKLVKDFLSQFVEKKVASGKVEAEKKH